MALRHLRAFFFFVFIIYTKNRGGYNHEGGDQRLALDVICLGCGFNKGRA